MKRILVVQKLISLGKRGGSITVPVFSSMCLEPVFVPVSLKPVSFTDSISLNLFENLKSYSECFKKELIHFDAVFYDSWESPEGENQLDNFVKDCISNDSFIIMNDCNNKTYNLFDFINQAENLTYINLFITKASSFIDFSITSREKSELFIRNKCKKIFDKVIILDFPVSSDKKAIITYDRFSDKIDWIYYKSSHNLNEMSGIYDLFAAIVSAAILNGISTRKSIKFAIDFINKVMKETFSYDNYNFYCLDYEKKISELSKFISDNSDIY